MLDAKITVSGGGAEYAAKIPNASARIFAALVRGRRYANKFILFTDGGEIRVDSELADMNTDPAARMFALRSALIKEGSFTLTGVALSADGITEDAVFALEEPFEKKAGEPLSVCAEIRIGYSRTNAALTRGDNPLAKWLLGEGALEKASLCGGHDRSPLCAAPYPTDDFSYAAQAQTVFGSDRVTFSAAVKAAPEMTLMLGGRSALKFKPLEKNTETVTASTRAAAVGRVSVGREFTEIISVSMDSAPLTDWRVERGRNRAGSPCETGLCFGAGAFIIADADASCAAVVNSEEACLLRVTDGEVSVLGFYRVKGRGVRLTRDKKLFSLDGGVLRRTGSGGDGEIELAEADSFEIAMAGENRYTLIARRGETAVVYNVENQTAAQTESFALGGDGVLLCPDGRRLAAAGSTFAARVFGSGADNADIEGFLDMVYADYGARSVSGRGPLISFTDDTGINYVADCLSGDGVDVDCEPGRKPFDGVFLNGGEMYLTDCDGGVRGMPCDVTRFTSACRIGGCVLALDGGGNLSYIPLGGSGGVILSDSVYKRANVTYVCRVPVTNVGASGVKSEVSVIFGQEEEAK